MVIAEYKWKKPTARTYFWPDGSSKTFYNLVHLRVAATGCHTLGTTNPIKFYIVAPGWRWVEQETQKNEY